MIHTACRRKIKQILKNSLGKRDADKCCNTDVKSESLKQSEHIAKTAMQFSVQWAFALFCFYVEIVKLSVVEREEVAKFGKKLHYK